MFQIYIFSPQIAKLCRSLRVPGDAGAKGPAERRLVTNLNDDFVKTGTQLSPNVVPSSTDQTEQGNQQAIGDELEEGGLC